MLRQKVSAVCGEPDADLADLHALGGELAGRPPRRSISVAGYGSAP
ncbi:hypothetical protein [Haliangium sp. UPWRP_2]|nr:hypothetical protein [Haliangium sp. UPWRP_2]